jgi:hypothetical protein
MHRSCPRLAAWCLALALTGPVSSGCNGALSSTSAVRSTADEGLARTVVNGSAEEVDNAIAALRSRGPDGLSLLLDVYDAEVARAKERPAAGDEAALVRLRGALDRVARQKEAYASRLYWFTDLDQAKRAAKDTRRPILSLRMLGNLDEELSCANSRFFRTALYPDAKVGKVLRDEFILYWSAERPAPVVTIDFGDGRTIKRTVTGNSLHYVLDSSGRVVDAIPGLYGPAAFVRAVEEAGALARATSSVDGAARVEAIRAHHAAELRKLETLWHDELTKSGVAMADATPLPGLLATTTSRPSAAEAAPIGVGKGMVESRIVNALVGAPSAKGTPAPVAIPWVELADRHLADAKLDESSRRVMATKNPMDCTSSPEPLVGSAFDAMVRGFEAAMAQDTVRNELTRHAAIHGWFVGEPGINFATLNQKVYSELFLTPASDPWLGLVPPIVYTGLENDGFVRP